MRKIILLVAIASFTVAGCNHSSSEASNADEQVHRLALSEEGAVSLSQVTSQPVAALSIAAASGTSLLDVSGGAIEKSLVSEKEMGGKEHLEIGKKILEQHRDNKGSQSPEFQSAIQHIKTAISLTLNYEERAQADFLIATYASDNLSANEHFELGKSLIEANHYDSYVATQSGMDEGIRQMKEAIRLNCVDLKKANTILANAYDQMLSPPKENSEADKLRVAERDKILHYLYNHYPGDIEILNMYASRATDRKEKIVVYTHVKELNPKLAHPHYMLGIFAIDEGKIAAGIDEIKTWIDLENDPSNASAYSTVVVEYLMAKGCAVPENEKWYPRFMDVERAMDSGESKIREQGQSNFKKAKQEFLAAISKTQCP